MNVSTKSLPVVAIVGPTCTGKTDLAIQIAQKFNGEIIALDSRTIYQKMDIGTAKPTPQQQKQIQHHALDILEPSRFFTVAEYVEVAQAAIDDILARGKLPIACGGTGLYARALLEGIQIPPVPPQPELREQLNDYALKNGNQELHRWLGRLDPLSASRLNVNDRRRVIRSLEVVLVTGQPFSALATQVEPPFQTTWIGLKWSDRDLHQKLISKRLDKQLADGLFEEVKNLWQATEYRDILASAINYKEFVPHIDKVISLEQACKQCIQDNFQLARKQMIWFRGRPQINWLILDGLAEEERINQVLPMLSGSMKDIDFPI